jgi:uncharacterized damage-inducible protein DinB
MKIDRNKFIEDMADYMTDNMSLVELSEYFYEATIDFLDDLSDEELLEQADWVGYTQIDEQEESDEVE